MQEYFRQTGKLFSAEIWKIAECQFWADVMLTQFHLRASRASPAKKLQGLRVVCSKNISRATFFLSGPLRWWIYIWAICLWNKFEKKRSVRLPKLMTAITMEYCLYVLCILILWKFGKPGLYCTALLPKNLNSPRL